MKTFRPTIALIATLYANVAHAYDFKVDGMCFSFIPDQFHSVALAEFETTDDDPDNEGYTGDFVIPSTVTYYGIKYTVKGIEGSPFRNVISLHIPESIEFLSGQNFDGAISLNSIEIDGSSFSYFVDNKAIYTPYYKKLIYSFDFECSEYSIKDGVEQVGDYAFCNSKNIKKLSYCEGIKNFGDVMYGIPLLNAFLGLTGVEELVIPSSMQMYHGSLPSVTYNSFRYLFEHLVSLKTITVDPRNQELCSIDGVLYDKDVTMLLHYPAKKSGEYIVPSTVAERIHIAPYNFNDEGVDIPSITLNNNITELWLHSSTLETINLPESVTDVSLRCPNLVDLNIPRTIKYISFQGCSSLPSLDLSHTTITRVHNTMFSECNSLKDLLLPSTITEVQHYCFAYMPALKNICLPAGVTMVGSSIFEDSQSIESITCLSQVPPTFVGDAQFEQYPIFCHSNDEFCDKVILYVPKGCANEYRSSQLWGQIKTIQEIETEDVLANSISISQSDLILKAGDSYTLNATILPSYATSKAIIWSSSNENIASVEDGVVTAIAVGEATITATTTDGSNLSASCKVTVVANHDEAIAELQTLVDQAQALYDNSTEGENIGQYAPGSRAALLAVIKAVKAKISSTMSESDITECTTQITNAINAFKAQQISAGADTDLSQFDNVVYVKSLEARAGGQAVLSLQLDNVDPVIGFELKLHLPEGVSVATSTDRYGDTNIEATLMDDRTSPARHAFETKLNGDVQTILCYSVKNYTFLGNSGEVAQITIDIANNVEVGDYPIIIKNEAISLKGSTPQIEYLKTTLTISDFKLGDANGDTFVNVGDISTVAAHILGDTPEVFIARAADANEDNFINVGDISTIAAMILDGTANNARQRGNREEIEISIADNAYELTAGTEILVPVCVNNTVDAFGSFQFDVEMPTGFEVKDIRLNEDRISRSDFFGFATVADGKVRVLDYTLSNQTVRDTEGAIAYITIASDRTLASGDYLLNLTNGCFSDAHHTAMAPSATILLSVSAPLGIESLSSSDKLVDVYTIQGQLIRSSVAESESLNGLQSGIYLIDGRKVIK